MEIPEEDIREVLAQHLGREPTTGELADFNDFLTCDVSDWLKENARCFLRDRSL